MYSDVSFGDGVGDCMGKVIITLRQNNLCIGDQMPNEAAPRTICFSGSFCECEINILAHFATNEFCLVIITFGQFFFHLILWLFRNFSISSRSWFAASFPLFFAS